MTYFNPWKPIPMNNPYTGSFFDPSKLQQPYYNPFTGIPAHGSPYSQQIKTEEEKEAETVVQQAVQKVQQDQANHGDNYTVEHFSEAVRNYAERNYSGPPSTLSEALGTILTAVIPGAGAASIISKVLGNKTESGLIDSFWNTKEYTPEQHRRAAELGYKDPAAMLRASQQGAADKGLQDFYDKSLAGQAEEYFGSNDFWSMSNEGRNDAMHSALADLRSVYGNHPSLQSGVWTAGKIRDVSAELANTPVDTQPQQSGSDEDHGGHSGGGVDWSNPTDNQDAYEQEAYGGGFSGYAQGGLVAMNNGGTVMKNSLVAYRQVGGDIIDADAGAPPGASLADGSTMPAPAPEMMPGGAPMAPEAAPAAPTAPPAPVRKTFADKVAEARDLIKSGQTAVPTNMPAAPMGMTDGQGDGPVQFGAGAGHLTQGEVGPDIGPDDVDAMIPEGSFVMNAEGTAMNGPELDMMEQQAGPAGFSQGSAPMIRAKLTRGERVMAPHVVARYRDRLEQMNEGGLMARYRTAGSTEPEKADAPAWNNRGQLGQIGSALVHIGQNDFTGASKALEAKPVDKAAAKELKTKEERIQAYKDSIDAATKAIQFIEKGAKTVIDYRSKSWTELLSEGGFDISTLVGYGAAEITGERAAAIEKALHNKFGGTAEWQAYTSFDQEVKLLELKARSLVKGGSISDNEAAAAAKTILNPSSNADTTVKQLQTVIERNQVSIENNGGARYESGAKAFDVTGTTYQPDQSVSLIAADLDGDGKKEDVQKVEVTPETLKEGQKFTSSDSSGDWIYEAFAKDDKAMVRITNSSLTSGEYELNYNPANGKWWIAGTTGTTYLTPIMEETDAG